MILKEMESQDGSLTDLEIIKKVKIFKWLLTFLKLSLERILKECTKLRLTEVSDTNGDSELEVNILRPLAEEEPLLVSKERKNDHLFIYIFLLLIK